VTAGKDRSFHGFPPHLSHNVATFWVKDMQCFVDCFAFQGVLRSTSLRNRMRSLWRYALLGSDKLHLEGLRNIGDGSAVSTPAAAKLFPCCAKTFNW
jgi:hypothetical protein